MAWLLADEESLMTLLAVSTEYRHVTDRQTDGQTSCDIVRSIWPANKRSLYYYSSSLKVVPFDRSHEFLFAFYCEIKRDIGRKSLFFHTTLLHNKPPYCRVVSFATEPDGYVQKYCKVIKTSESLSRMNQCHRQTTDRRQTESRWQ